MADQPALRVPPAILAGEAAAQIRAHPETHEQDSWFRLDQDSDLPVEELRSCGTKACVAGWAILLAAPAGTRIIDDGEKTVIRHLDGTLESVGDYAAELLGIHLPDDNFMPWLFEAGRTRGEVLRVLDWMAAGNRYDDKQAVQVSRHVIEEEAR